MNNCHVIHLDETSSTNTFLASYTPSEPTDITIVTTDYQSAGRGQASNRWESERGKNLLFSILVTPDSLPATHLFALSEAIALSIREAIATTLISLGKTSTNNEHILCETVKWPNDIYIGDSKIAGILIENNLRGQYVHRSVIGCGVNINQSSFLFPSLVTTDSSTSNIPHPVSMRQLLGRDIDRQAVLDAVIAHFLRRYRGISNGQPDALAAIHAEYLDALYRRQGLHLFADAQGSFRAEIADVEPTGHLLLRDTSGHLRRYAFKEVSYC